MLLDADVAEPSLVAVVGQHDVTFARSEADLALKFAGGDALLPFIGGCVGF